MIFLFIKKILVLIICLSGLLAQIKLSVNTIPKRVEIFLDGKAIGKTPIKNGNISMGEHQFLIDEDGYAPLKYDLIVNASEAVHLDFFLNPIYKVKFKTEENSLIFQLNNEHQWDDKLIRLELEAGEHFLRVFKLGEIIDEQVIMVDEPKSFEYFLKRPILEK
tara:strand:- start:3073 stop:3561 length:489 start_codon:yes stop_codon:yes gene_type:complete